MNSSVKNILDDAKKVLKDLGDGILTTLSSGAIRGIPVVVTGIPQLDVAVGIGGMPQGRVIEIYGPESCLAGNTYIPYDVYVGDKRINHKGGRISRLYERFHDVTVDGESNQGRHLRTKSETIYYIKSVNEDNAVIRNNIVDVVKTGLKECYEVITESGEHLTSTLEHKYRTVDGFMQLKHLKVGDCIMVHNNSRVHGRNKRVYKSTPEIGVKYHPFLSKKTVHCNKVDKDYPYYRGSVGRLTYEANMNCMSLTEYVVFLNTQSHVAIRALKFIPSGMHIHHIDEDFNNNKFDNLVLVDSREHGKLHGKTKRFIKNLNFVAVPSKIVSITSVGKLETYDIKCESPYNNYVANGIVVHNSGKTTLCLKIIAQAQAQGGVCGMVDAEHAFDPAWARVNGVDTDNLIISQPDCGEDALTVAEYLVNKGCAVVLVDSVSALVPRAELEGNFGDSNMGLQARMMSQAMRKLTSKTSKSKSILIFINQIRMKIGVMFGNPETTSGGQALKFSTSVRMDIRVIEAVRAKKEKATAEEKAIVRSMSKKEKAKIKQEAYKEEKKLEIIGNRVRIKIVKNKVAPPFKTCEAVILFDSGFDTVTNLFECLEDSGKITRSGSSYSIGGHLLGVGVENAMNGFVNDYSDKLGDFYDEYVQGKLAPAVDESGITDEDRAEIEAIRKRRELKKKAKKHAKAD